MSASRMVSEIFSVKEWHDLETRGRDRSRSLKMVPFDRPYTTFYWSAIVSSKHFCRQWRLKPSASKTISSVFLRILVGKCETTAILHCNITDFIFYRPKKTAVLEKIGHT